MRLRSQHRVSVYVAIGYITPTADKFADKGGGAIFRGLAIKNSRKTKRSQNSLISCYSNFFQLTKNKKTRIKPKIGQKTPNKGSSHKMSKGMSDLRH